MCSVLLVALYGKAHILLRLDCYYHKIRPALSPDVYSYLVCPVKLLASKKFVSWCYKKEYVAKTKLKYPPSLVTIQDLKFKSDIHTKILQLWFMTSLFVLIKEKSM